MGNDSSLDRFLRNRAIFGIGLAGKRAYWIQRGVGALMLAFGIGLLVAPLFGAPPEVAASAIGPLIAGAVNLGVSFVLKRRFSQLGNANWQLTTEAKLLLVKLVRKRLGWWNTGGFTNMETGMPFPFGRKRLRRTLRHLAWANGESGSRWSQSATQDVSPDVESMLERAAEQFNRIQGMLQNPATDQIAKMVNQGMAAADEAMGDILDDAATMDKFPESQPANRARTESAIGSLKELADRLEDLATRPASAGESVGYKSSIDSVLEELRLDQLARTELQAPPAEEHQHLTG